MDYIPFEKEGDSGLSEKSKFQLYAVYRKYT